MTTEREEVSGGSPPIPPSLSWVTQQAGGVHSLRWMGGFGVWSGTHGVFRNVGLWPLHPLELRPSEAAGEECGWFLLLLSAEGS